MNYPTNMLNIPDALLTLTLDTLLILALDGFFHHNFPTASLITVL